MKDANYSRIRTRQGKLPLSTKIYQGIGAIPDTYKNFAFGTFLLFYYNQVLGMPAVYASVAIMMALVVDAITDPLVGSYSDGLQSKLGRRHPLMFLSILPLGFSLFMVFSPPDGLSDLGHFFWLAAFAIATRISMTFFSVPYSALFAEFSDDYAERSAILTFRYLCGWTGAVIFTWCTWTFIFPGTPEFETGHLNPEAYKLFAPVLALLVMATAFASTLLTRREIPYLLQPVSPPKFGVKNAFQEVLLALTNKDFVVLFIALFLSSILGGTLGALEIYINTYFWGLLPTDIRWFTIAVTGSILAFISIPVLQSRFDKKHLLITAMMFLLVNGITLICLRFLDILPNNGNPILLRILVANETIRVMALTIVGIMFASMVADTLDKQELATSKRQEGVFASALSFAAKVTSGVGIFFSGLILDYVLAFPRGIEPSKIDADLLVRLGVVAGVIIPLLYLVPFWMTTKYSITRANHAEIQQALITHRG